MRSQEHDLNEAAYRRMEETINATYSHGHFVGIAGGQIVADADDFMTLYNALKLSGRDPRDVLIVQAGHVYLKEAVIFCDRRIS